MESVTLEGLLRQYITNSINGMFTAIPARIVDNVNLKEQRVDVQIVIDKVTTDNQSRHHPVILNVPIVFQASKTSQITFPVSVGDTVLCIFSQRSLDRFKLGSSNTHTPLDFRKYSRADAMAIPGLFTFPDAINDPSKHTLEHSTEDLVVAHNIGTDGECEVRLKASGDITINAPGNKVEVNCEDSVVNADNSATVNTNTSTVNAEQSSEVNTQTATINASTSTTIDSPSTTVTGNLLVEGHLTYVSGLTGSGGSGSTATINGNVKVSGEVTADSDVIGGGVSLKDHTHTGDDGGSTSSPR